jgi:D-amino peptidase
MSKAYISCDMEGCSGIVNNQFCNPKGKFYEEGRTYMTGDLKAAIEGLQSAGVDDILVNDSHWDMTNVRVEDLPDNVNLISGGTKLDSMGEGLDDSFDAVLLIGYHTRWGTERGVIAHTYSDSVMEVRINDQAVGEAGILAGLAGSYGVPVIFVSGDDQLREEVQSLNPNTHFTVTKEGLTMATAKLYHPEDVRKNITAEAKKAWLNRKKIPPVTFDSPVEVAMTFKESQMADMCLRLPGAIRVNNLTVSYTHKDYISAYRAFLALLTIGGSAKVPA